MRWHWLIVLASLLGCVACGSVISPQVQSLADPEFSYAKLASNPEAYVGKVVIIAGTIIEAVNTPEGTRLVLLQYPTNRRGRPQIDASSGGRFLVLAPEYLETAIYRSGRALTVAGEVRGQRGLPSVRPCIIIPFWHHAKCISGPRAVAVPRCSTLALVLGSVRAYSRCWHHKWSTEWPAHMRPDCRAAWTGMHLKLEGGVREDYRSTSISPVDPATAAELDGARNQHRSDLDPGRSPD